MREKDVVILISGAGGATGINTIKSLGLANFKGKIVAIDSSKYSAGFYLADSYYQVPEAKSPKYIGILDKLIKKESVNLILPTSGFDIFPISKNKPRFNKSCVIFMSDYSTVLLCTDKYKAAKKVEGKVSIPKYYNSIREVKKYPIFIKPRIGKGSENCYVCYNKRQFESIQSIHNFNFLIQEFLPGKEYTVDLLSDLDKKVIVAVPRLRIKADSGVTVIGKTLINKSLISAASEIASSLGIRGPCCVQFKEDKRGVAKFTEINPRLGGGSIISTLSGVNIPKLIIDLVLQESVRVPIMKEITVTRFLDEILIKNPSN